MTAADLVIESLSGKVRVLEAELKRLREHPELTDAQCDAIADAVTRHPLDPFNFKVEARAVIRKALEDSNGL